jgi:uncharacterized protein YaeQ
MSGRYGFTLTNRDRRRDLPPRLIIGREHTETEAHVLLKLMAFVLFHRERVQVEPRLPDESIGFEPDIVQLDYTLRPTLWVECGECSVRKLDKLAVKVPEAELWVVKKSDAEAEHLLRLMQKEDLRRDRYGIVALDTEMFTEMSRLLGERNELLWVSGEFDPPQLQFDFNGLWFDTAFRVYRH